MKRCRFKKLLPCPVPEWFTNQDKKITLLHIDTEHSYSMAKAEFEAYEPLLDIPFAGMTSCAVDATAIVPLRFVNDTFSAPVAIAFPLIPATASEYVSSPLSTT